MTEFERNCYGMTTEAIEKHIVNGISAKFSGLGMAVGSLLSDAQHQMEFGDVEGARKTLNVAKYVIFEHMMEQKSLANV